MEEGKDDLGDFLSEELLSFINDESSLPSTSSHTYQNSSCNNVLSEDIDSLLLQTIESYEDSNEKASSTISRPFSDPVSGENIEQAIQNSIPESTKRDTKYCISMWDEWIVNRAKAAGTVIPYLKDITLTELQHWLCYFTLELRKKSGAKFPPNSLYHICCGIMRYVRMNGMNVDFFKDKEFSKFCNVLDSEMKRLKAVGLGTGQRKAEVISFEDEELMWEKGILGDDNPQSLLDTMLFMNGLYFALRGGKEHRQLRHHPSQIELIEKPGERAYLIPYG